MAAGGERVVPPPVIFLGSLAAALLLEWFWPSGFVPGDLGYWIGGVLVAAGVALFAAAWRELARHATSIVHHKATRAIVSSGPYARSRNPVYVAMAIFVAGLAVMTDSLWVLATVASSVVLVDRLVITREERFLEATFGEAYGDYKSRVRRWL